MRAASAMRRFRAAQPASRLARVPETAALFGQHRRVVRATIAGSAVAAGQAQRLAIPDRACGMSGARSCGGPAALRNGSVNEADGADGDPRATRCTKRRRPDPGGDRRHPP
jgi:hypothetical protein